MANFITQVGRSAVHRPRWAACLAIWLVTWVTWWATPARGQQPEVSLRWEAPTDCPSGEAFTERIEQLLGRPLKPQASQSQRVSVVIQPRGDALHLRIDIGGPPSPDRELEGPSCASLVEAAALFVALTLDSEAPAAEPAPPPSPPALQPLPSTETSRATEASQRTVETGSSEALSTPPPPAAPRTESTRRRRRPRPASSLHAGLSAVFDSGALPGPSGGVDGALGWTRARLSLEVSALWLAPRRADVDASGVSVQLAGAAWRVCGRLTANREGRFALSGCPVVEAGALLSRARQGIDAGGRRERSPWLAAGGGLQGRLRVAPGWDMVLWGGVLAPLVRAKVAVLSADGMDLQVLYRPKTWTARIGLGVKRTF